MEPGKNVQNFRPEVTTWSSLLSLGTPVGIYTDTVIQSETVVIVGLEPPTF